MLRWACLIGLVFVTLLLGGCSQQVMMNPTSIIHAPTKSGEMAGVQEVVEASLSTNARLIFPRRVTPLSAIHFVCFQDESRQEAIAFYKENTYDLGFLHVQQEVDGQWKLAHQYALNGSEVNDAYFLDVTGDGRPELLIGTTDDGGETSYLTVLQYEGAQWKPLLDTQYYEQLALGDLDGDGSNEIVLLQLERGEAFTASLYRYGENSSSGEEYRGEGGESDSSLQLTSTLQLDPYVNGFDEPVQTGYFTREQQALFLDLGYGAHSAVTMVLGVRDGQLVDLLADQLPSNTDYDMAMKIHPQPSCDINQDGITEIATQLVTIGNEELSYAEMPLITNWAAWDENRAELKTVAQSYSSVQAGFQFLFPTAWIDQVTVGEEIGSEKDRHPFESKVTFYYVDENGQRQDELLMLYMVAPSYRAKLEELYPAPQYQVTTLATIEERIYCGVQPQKLVDLPPELLLSREQLEQGFRLSQRRY